MKNPEEEISVGSSEVPDGPDTSSFTAFMVSLLTSSDKNSPNVKDIEEQHFESKEKASPLGSKENSKRKSLPSTPGTKEHSGKRNLFSRGKHKIGRGFHKAVKISGFRQRSEGTTGSSVATEPNFAEHNSESPGVMKGAYTKFNLPPMSETSSLLSNNLRAALYFSLPALVQGRNWVLLYSTSRHGISLSTLYRRSALCPGFSLLVVGDKKGAVFGGLVEAPLSPTKQNKYQGTSTSFVFTDLSNDPVIFWPTGSNHYFTLCSSDYLALGGGGHFALYLDEDLSNGSSSSSETFGNSCLAHSAEFEVKEVELWGFVYASKYDEMIDLCQAEQPGLCRW